MDRSELQRCEIPSNRNWVVRQNHIFQLDPDEANDVTGFDEGLRIWDLFFLQDMFQAISTNEKYIIDVSWVAEGDPDGHYHLVLITWNENEKMFNWREPLIVYDTRSTDQLLLKIRELMSE